MKHRIALYLLFVAALCMGCGNALTKRELMALEARINDNSRTMEIIKILPVSDTKYKKAIKSFLREHPQYFYMHINKPTG